LAAVRRPVPAGPRGASAIVARVAELDGDGWARCGQGHVHWGRFGAVGLLAWSGGPEATRVLLVRRSRWGQHGGTWGPPGGARDSDEAPLAAALREAAEESGLPPGGVTLRAMLLDDHGGWSYRTYVAAAAEPFPVHPASHETTDARWVDVADVASLPLHPGFAEHWPSLSRALVPVSVIVDVANVMGARADGWWRDRAAAALRLRDQLSDLSERGVAGLPRALDLPALDLWYPDFVLVTEGAARSAVLRETPRLRVVAARGSGDDAIVAQVRALPGRRLVVTADRELRRRCAAVGASVTGPGWLLDLI
jgi:8-oxo-dGTP pyrophosphatase MutT (NUDIX family)